MIPGKICGGVSPLRFSRMAMYSFTCLIPPKNVISAESYRHEFTTVTVSEREFHSALDLATVSYKRRMTTRFGRNWSLDGLKRVARSQSKIVSFSNSRAQGSLSRPQSCAIE